LYLACEEWQKLLKRYSALVSVYCEAVKEPLTVMGEKVEKAGSITVIAVPKAEIDKREAKWKRSQEAEESTEAIAALEQIPVSRGIYSLARRGNDL